MTQLPLNGIRVLDLSRVFAMPYAGAFLSDLGAEVIKVDSCQAQFIDTTRTLNGPTRTTIRENCSGSGEALSRPLTAENGA